MYDYIDIHVYIILIPVFPSVFSGQEGAGSSRHRQSAGYREVLPVTTSKYPDVVGASGTADSVKRNRSYTTPAHVQLPESYFASETTANPAVGLRG